MAKQVRTDLALFKRRKVDAVEAARQRLGQVGLAHAQGKFALQTPPYVANPSQRRAPCAPSRCMIIIPRTASARLPIPAGELLLNRIRSYGWVEIQGEKHHTAIRLTPAGLQAMRSAI